MHDIITNGTEIKQRILSEFNNSKYCLYIAMAWFTDRDIATAIIEAKKRGVKVDVILSSNSLNEVVKLMLIGANISVHAFETGDSRGLMHHKFCLVDDRLSINGSYNFSYNASNNNVENIHVTDDPEIYRQLLSEFDRLKFNIENHINVNSSLQIPEKPKEVAPHVNILDSFSSQLHHLVYSSAQISTDEYKKRGYEKAKECGGNTAVFKTEYNTIKEEIRVYATDEGLSALKNILTSNISSAYESKKNELELARENEMEVLKRNGEFEVKQVSDKNEQLREEKSALEIGKQDTGDRGLLQINKDIETNKLERKALEESIIVKKFWSVSTILAMLGLCVFVYYLSLFFASAMYKVFFEANEIQQSLEAGINRGLPQLVDANAIVKIFNNQGGLFGIMAALFFLIPIMLSNLELWVQKKWITNLGFWIGILIFDIIVSIVVAMNTDKIESLLIGKEPQLKIWDVIWRGEFWLIFVFGMLPLIITHFIINYLKNAYNQSRREIVDAEKTRKIQVLSLELIDLNAQKELFSSKISELEHVVRSNNERIAALESDLNTQRNQLDSKYLGLSNQINFIYEDYRAKIISGKIFTNEIFDSVISAFKSGFIEYLPEYFSEAQVTSRVREIEESL